MVVRQQFLPVAKVANPEITVWQISGDGDGLAIGGNHFIHAVRRNIDLNMILLNNRIYGLTKGQYSRLLPVDLSANHLPYGTVEDPFIRLNYALVRGRFFARAVNGWSWHGGSSEAAPIIRVLRFEILQNCVILMTEHTNQYIIKKVVQECHLFGTR